MRILLIGGSGFIGKNFLLRIPKSWECVAIYNTSKDFESFLKKNNLANIKSLKIDLTDELHTTTTLNPFQYKFDICLYLMGNSNIALARKDPLIDVKINIHSLINLLQNIKVKKFIFMSSGAVYEGYRSFVNPTMKVAPTIPYSINKFSSEQFIRFYQENTDNIDSYINIRFFGAYGPMEPDRKIYTNLIKAFLLEKKNQYTIMGNGKNFIDAMYITDTIDALLKMIISDKGNLTVDLCFGQPLTINELVLEIGRILGLEVKLEHKGDAAEYTTFFASINAMEALFNFKPSISLKDGILNFADYLQHKIN